MRVIDSNTGHEVSIGEPFSNVDGRVTVIAVREGWFSAEVLLSVDGVERGWEPLTVRYMHPGFQFQKVGFINS